LRRRARLPASSSAPAQDDTRKASLVATAISFRHQLRKAKRLLTVVNRTLAAAYRIDAGNERMRALETARRQNLRRHRGLLNHSQRRR